MWFLRFVLLFRLRLMMLLVVGNIGRYYGLFLWHLVLVEMSWFTPAARAHIMRDEVSDPLAEYRKVNVEGTLNLAKQAGCCGVGVKRFVLSALLVCMVLIRHGPLKRRIPKHRMMLMQFLSTKRSKVYGS